MKEFISKYAEPFHNMLLIAAKFPERSNHARPLRPVTSTTRVLPPSSNVHYSYPSYCRRPLPFFAHIDEASGCGVLKCVEFSGELLYGKAKKQTSK